MNTRLVLLLPALAVLAAAWPARTLAAPPAPPNELGRVPVMEYHRFGTVEDRWTRTYDHFRADLEYLYNNGYVSVSASALAAGKLDVPAGKKPVIFTFDDSTSEQFVFLHDAHGAIRRDAKGNPMVDPRSAVGILDAFSARHPDFGRAATFYPLPGAFETPAEAGEKLRYLLASGRELGNHTYTHASLKKLATPKIVSELSMAQDEVGRELGRTYRLTTLALPFGIYPKDAAGARAVVSGGSGGSAYRNTAIFLVGADPAPSPFDRKFNFMKVPRIQAIDAEWQRHFRRPAGSIGVSDEAFRPYVSDGDPRTVAVPSKLEDRLNPGALGGRKAVVLP